MFFLYMGERTFLEGFLGKTSVASSACRYRVVEYTTHEKYIQR